MERITEAYEGIAIDYEERVVRVASGAALDDFFARPDAQATALADHILARHAALFGRALDISRDSLAIEILGHVFAEDFAGAVDRFADTLPGELGEALGRLAQKVLDRTDVIDCGEAEVDGNRFIWDALVPLRRLIYRFGRRGDEA